MDWAMKSLPTRYREKQSQGFGKRGLSWHISCVHVISKVDGKLRTQSFAHIFDNCSQDWYAVVSIVENILKTIGDQNPNISAAYLRSDEGACYHNNMTMAACQDISKLTVWSLESTYLVITFLSQDKEKISVIGSFVS